MSAAKLTESYLTRRCHRRFLMTVMRVLAIACLGCTTSLLTTLSKSPATGSSYAYWPPVVLVTVEVLKAAISLAMLCWEKDPEVSIIANATCSPPPRSSIIRLAGLAVLYALQNNLLFAAMAHVNLATYHVLISLRIPFTAWLMHVALKRDFSKRQYGAIVCLVIGAVSSQVDILQLFSSSNDLSQVFTVTPSGLFYMLVSVVCASVASVVNENMLKDEAIGSLHAQNFLLYSWGSFINAILLGRRALFLVNSAGSLALYRGFNCFTWALVASLTCLGLVTSAVLKYADNMIRSLGYVGSIVMASALTSFCLGTALTPSFAIGAGLSCVGIWMYMVDSEAF